MAEISQLLLTAAFTMVLSTSNLTSSPDLNLEQLYIKVIHPFSKLSSCELKLNYQLRFVSVQSLSCKKFPSDLNKNWPISKLQIANTKISALVKGTFSELNKVVVLDITGNQLTQLEDECLYGLHELQNLTFISNKLSSLPSGTFKGLKNLKFLTIRKTYIKSIKEFTIAASVLPNLKALDLSFNILDRIDSQDFLPISKSPLIQLNLQLCSLSYISPTAFRPLKLLRRLNLSGNSRLSNQTLIDIVKSFNKGSELKEIGLSKMRYTEIPTNLFKLIDTHTQVTGIYFQKYTIPTLLEDSIPYMPNIKMLNLNNNAMRNIEAGAFENVPNLQVLVTERNFFDRVPEAVSALTSLTTLKMSNAGKFLNFFSLDKFNFSKNFVLKFVDISRNKIDIVSGSSFPGAFSFESLMLSGCHISTITSDAFKHMKNLRYLDLSNNPLTQVSEYGDRFLPGLGQLQFLSISSSKLVNSFNGQKIEIFKHLKSLKELDIQKANVAHINKELFKGLNNLESLNLQGNILSEWTEIIFSQLKNLKILNLSDNKLSGKGDVILKDISSFGNQTTVDMSGNPFDCRCENRQFIEWLRSDSSHKVKIRGFNLIEGKQYYRCHSMKNNTVISIKFDDCVSDVGHDITALVSYVVMGVCSVLLFFVILYTVMVKYNKTRYVSQILMYLKVKSKRSLENDIFTYDAFISYSSHDYKWINRNLLPNMEKDMEKVRLCIYERDFIAGRDISACVLNSIEKSRTIVLVLTNNFLKSQWCLWELQMAQYLLLESNRNDQILLIILEKLKTESISPLLRFLLTTKIYLEWKDDASPEQKALFWEKLRETIVKS